MTKKAAINELKAYAKANKVAEESFGSIRTIHSLNGINHTTRKYDNLLNETEVMCRRKGIAYSAFNSVGLSLVIWIYPIILYAGHEFILIKSTNTTLDDILVILTCVVDCLVLVVALIPFLQSLAGAAAASSPIWQIIDEVY